MLESVYQNCLAYRLRSRDLFVETEKAVPVLFEEIKMECGYRADLVVEKEVLVEVKSIEAIAPLHTAQGINLFTIFKFAVGLIAEL